MRLRVAVGILVAASAWALLACDRPSTPDASVDAEASCSAAGLEGGAGGARPRALPTSGGELEIVLGSQGGIHVVVAAWIGGLPLDGELTYRLLDAQDRSPLAVTTLDVRPSLLMPDSGRFVRHPDLLVLDDSSPALDRFADREAELRVEYTTTDGLACDARLVTLVPPE